MKLFELDAINEQYFSPYCWRILMALNHKGLFEKVERVPVKFSNKSAIIHKGFNTVPVLEDNGTWIGGSLEIAKYLDTKYSNLPSLFGNVKNTKLTSLINLYMDPKILSILARIIVADVYETINPDDKIYFRESRENMLNKSLEEVEKESKSYIPIFQKEINPFRKLLKDSDFFLGSKPMYCDYMLFGFFMWARNVSKKQILEKDDILWAWRDKMLNLFNGFAKNSNGYDIK